MYLLLGAKILASAAGGAEDLSGAVVHGGCAATVAWTWISGKGAAAEVAKELRFEEVTF